MKAKVNPETCIGCTICVGICPAVFRMEENKAVVFVEIIPSELHILCRKATGEGPVQAIEIQET